MFHRITMTKEPLEPLSRDRQDDKVSQRRGCWALSMAISDDYPPVMINMGMDQYLLIPFLGGWTSIYQLFWCSPGVQGFDPFPHSYWKWSFFSWQFPWIAWWFSIVMLVYQRVIAMERAQHPRLCETLSSCLSRLKGSKGSFVMVIRWNMCVYYTTV